MTNFRAKPWVNLLEKCQFFDFFNFLFLLPRNAFFRSRISWKTFYLALLSKKKKFQKWPIFEQNHGLTFWKNVNFSTFSTSCFYCREMRFFVLEYHETHFTYLYSLKKKMEKWPVFEQNHGLTPLEKCQFFDFWTSCFYCLEMRFFVLEYHKTRFPCLYCLKKISWKNDKFSRKTMG